MIPGLGDAREVLGAAGVALLFVGAFVGAWWLDRRAGRGGR